MVVVGADVHKWSHTFVAVDEAGRKLGELTVKADPTGHDKAIRWAQRCFGSELIWGIEDCRHLSARLEIDLLTAAQRVVRVPPKMMAEQRRTARTRGKSDPIDALAVARAVVRQPDLPVATHDEASRELKLLVDHRDDLVEHRTQVINRFRWHLHRIDPMIDPAKQSMDRPKTCKQLASYLAGLDGIDARLARELLDDIAVLTIRANALEKEISGLVFQLAPRAAGHPGLWAVDRSEDCRGDRRYRQILRRGQVCDACRGRSDPGLVGTHRRSGAVEPVREPATQRRPAPHRRHSTPPRWPRQDLLRQTHQGRRRQDRSHSLPKTTPRPHRLQHPQTQQLGSRKGTTSTGRLT